MVRRYSQPIKLLYGVERETQRPTRSNQKPSKKQMIKAAFARTAESMKTEAKPTAFQEFVRSNQVRGACSTMIMLNALFMGVAAHFELQALIKDRSMEKWWEYTEYGFALFFLLELILRLIAERSEFIFSEDCAWNLFDTFLVLLSIIDVALGMFTEAEAVNLSFARSLRIFRFARILRIVRVFRFFYTFRLMVYSVLYSIVSLLWVFVLLAFAIYFFAIFFLNGVAEHFRGASPKDSEFDDTLLGLFGTLPGTALALFQGISGGLDWDDLMTPLMQLSWVYGVLFFFYIFFMVFGVLNVVMASFVESATQISRKDRELVTRNEMEKNMQYAQSIRRFFHEADEDGTGTLSWEEFEKYLQNDKVQAYFQSFELDVTQARTLFKLLDLDESNDVGIDEFIEGCMRMKGPARSIDVNMLLYESEKFIERQVDFMGFVAEHLLKFEDSDRGKKPMTPSARRKLLRRAGGSAGRCASSNSASLRVWSARRGTPSSSLSKLYEPGLVEIDV